MRLRARDRARSLPPLCTGMPGLAVFVPEGQKGVGVCGRVKNIWNFLNGIVMVRIYM